MGESLRAHYLEALDVARATLGDIADQLGTHYRTLQGYKRAERGVSVDVALHLVGYLRRRARELERTADRLEAAVDKEETQ